MKTEYRIAAVVLLLIVGIPVMSVGISGCIEPIEVNYCVADEIPDIIEGGYACKITEGNASQHYANITSGKYACITIGGNHTAFINAMKVSDGLISADGRSYITPGVPGGDSEVEVITYKNLEELETSVDNNMGNRIVKFKAGSDLATKVK